MGFFVRKIWNKVRGKGDLLSHVTTQKISLPVAVSHHDGALENQENIKDTPATGRDTPSISLEKGKLGATWEALGSHPPSQQEKPSESSSAAPTNIPIITLTTADGEHVELNETVEHQGTKARKPDPRKNRTLHPSEILTNEWQKKYRLLVRRHVKLITELERREEDQKRAEARLIEQGRATRRLRATTAQAERNSRRLEQVRDQCESEYLHLHQEVAPLIDFIAGIEDHMGLTPGSVPLEAGLRDTMLAGIYEMKKQHQREMEEIRQLGVSEMEQYRKAYHQQVARAAEFEKQKKALERTVARLTTERILVGLGGSAEENHPWSQSANSAEPPRSPCLSKSMRSRPSSFILQGNYLRDMSGHRRHGSSCGE